MRNWLTAALIVLATAGMAWGSQLAVLQNGFTIRHERHEVLGTTTRLYTDSASQNYIDVPTDQVASYAPDDTPPPAPAQPAAPKPDVHAMVQKAGTEHGVDPDFVASVVHAESNFNAHAISPKGACGLMQLMPRTAQQLGVKDSFDPAANVDAGTKYLRALLDEYHGDAAKALAAYNAGEKRVEQYKGVPPYRETHAYVRRIIAEYNRKKAEEKKSANVAPARTAAAQ